MLIRVERHLIVPFGRMTCESHRMRIVGSSTHEMLIETEAPSVYIDRHSDKAITLDQISSVFSIDELPARQNDRLDQLYSVCDTLRNKCDLQGSHEHLFLMLYFDQLAQVLDTDLEIASQLQRFLMPLPKAHLYLPDLSQPHSSECGQKCVTVDFAFWNGYRFIAVFLNDSAPSLQDKEKLLRFWGVEAFRIKTETLETGGLEAFRGYFGEIFFCPFLIPVP